MSIPGTTLQLKSEEYLSEDSTFLELERIPSLYWRSLFLPFFSISSIHQRPDLVSFPSPRSLRWRSRGTVTVRLEPQLRSVMEDLIFSFTVTRTSKSKHFDFFLSFTNYCPNFNFAWHPFHHYNGVAISPEGFCYVYPEHFNKQPILWETSLQEEVTFELHISMKKHIAYYILKSPIKGFVKITGIPDAVVLHVTSSTAETVCTFDCRPVTAIIDPPTRDTYHSVEFPPSPRK